MRNPMRTPTRPFNICTHIDDDKQGQKAGTEGGEEAGGGGERENPPAFRWASIIIRTRNLPHTVCTVSTIATVVGLGNGQGSGQGQV